MLLDKYRWPVVREELHIRYSHTPAMDNKSINVNSIN